MSTIFYEHISATSTPARFLKAGVPVYILDCRYRRQPGGYDPTQLGLLYPGQYTLLPALGMQTCANGDGGLEQVIDWQRGLADVQALFTPLPAYAAVLCNCILVQGRGHRIRLALRLAEAFGMTAGGVLR